MAGDRHQIDLHRLDIERNLAGGLRGIGVEQDATGPTQRTDLVKRLNDANLVMRRHDRHQKRAVGDRFGESIDRDKAARLDRQIGHSKTFALQRGGAFEHAFVLGRHCDQVIPNLVADGMRPREMRRAFEREVVRLGRTRGEHDFARIGADQPRHLATRRLDRRHRVMSIDMALAVRVAELLCEIGQHRLEHARIQRRGGLIVEIDRRRVWPLRQRGARKAHAALAAAACGFTRRYIAVHASRKCSISASVVLQPKLTRIVEPAISGAAPIACKT